MKVVKLGVGNGFGLENDSVLNAKKKFAIRVSDKIDYCVSFWIKQDVIDASLELSLTSFDCEFRKKISKNILNGESAVHFVRNGEKILSNKNRYHYCRFIIYNSDKEPNAEYPRTSFAAGRNLIMAKDTTNIFINLISTRNYITIWDFKVRPLSTPFSTGFIGTNNLLQIWRKNNKSYKSNEEIDNIARDYLLPYNAIQAVINL